MRFALVGADTPEHELTCTHWSGLKQAMDILKSKDSTFEWAFFSCRENKGFTKQIIDWRPDIVVYGLIDMAINNEARQIIRDGLPNATICFWYADLRNGATGQIETDLSKTVDKMFLSNDGQKEFIKKHFNMEDVTYVGQAVQPIPKPQIADKAKTRFLFIGAKSDRPGFKERCDLITELERTQGLRVVNGNLPSERSKIYQAMPKLYSSAQFSLDISHFWDIEKYTSNRFWVIPGFWGFALTKRFPGHEDLYPESVRVYWDTIEELQEKMKYYSEHESERLDMIKKGWQHTVDNHTYVHRLQKILSMV